MFRAPHLSIALGIAASSLVLPGCHSLPQTAPQRAPQVTRSAQRGGIPSPIRSSRANSRTVDAREAFREALLRVPQEPPQTSATASDPPALRAYILYDYLIAARLQFALHSAPSDGLDTVIDGFLQAHAGQPVTLALRREWLESLADRQRWDWFLPRALHLSDPLLICDRLAGRLGTGDTTGLAAEALAWWQQPIEQPAACDSVFAWLGQQQLLTPALNAARMRAALAAGNARLAREFAADATAGEISPDELAPLLQWARLLQSPRATLEELAAHPATPVEPEALDAGFSRLALHDSAAAAALLPSLLARPDMTAALQLRLQRDAALGLAYDHNPAALPIFAALPALTTLPPLQAPAAPPPAALPSAASPSPGAASDSIDTRLLEWRVRAALWAADYAHALTWIGQMPDALATQPRWRYWRARAVEALHGAAAAAPMYADIAGLRDYYGYLAADRLHRPYQLNAHATIEDPGVQRLLGADPGLVRAHELLACDLYDDAVAEWAAALADSPGTVKVQAALLAAHWGWYAQSIATLAQAGEWDDVRLRYPRPYPDLIAAASQRTRLPADWILAVMRQESLFRADAVSRADARGLMQLELSTAGDVAQRWHLPPPDATSLFDPPTAVTLGAAHLRELLDLYDGRLAVALAAYNAGTDALARWLPDKPMDADVWIENIPYDETRTYVEAILEHIVAYGWTRGASPPQLATLLPPVGPVAPALGRASP